MLRFIALYERYTFFFYVANYQVDQNPALLIYTISEAFCIFPSSRKTWFFLPSVKIVVQLLRHVLALRLRSKSVNTAPQNQSSSIIQRENRSVCGHEKIWRRHNGQLVNSAQDKGAVWSIKSRTHWYWKTCSTPQCQCFSISDIYIVKGRPDASGLQTRCTDETNTWIGLVCISYVHTSSTESCMTFKWTRSAPGCTRSTSYINV